MPLTLTPDVEALVGTYLRANTDVAAIVGTRVGGRTPANTDQPWIRVTQIDDEVDAPVLHMVTVHLQLECYAGNASATGHEQASTLYRTVRAVLAGLRGAQASGVVSAVRFGSARRLPDTDLAPARERFVMAVSVTVHP